MWPRRIARRQPQVGEAVGDVDAEGDGVSLVGAGGVGEAGQVGDPEIDGDGESVSDGDPDGDGDVEAELVGDAEGDVALLLGPVGRGVVGVADGVAVLVGEVEVGASRSGERTSGRQTATASAVWSASVNGSRSGSGASSGVDRTSAAVGLAPAGAGCAAAGPGWAPVCWKKCIQASTSARYAWVPL
ncbi:hypothetical protein [Microlunatus endophyticus]|uniref:hypothetical protein n=1 Tax=Microlunatus endophyticus TaxID=1716077 RepID=UPI001668955B|nr:hypothetical protein [Microlunatus endophyticus]